MANNILAKMAVQISANTAEFNKALTKTSKDISSFTGTVKTMAAGIATAFSVQQIAQFALQTSRLAGEFEAVNGAFKRLPDSIQLLEDLKTATGGTVSELELMKRAVQASNFDISLKALPRLLEFATLRAQQTGQSVDYLVDSIVTGIGRKSKLILDNLGISAVQLTEALGGASAAASSIGDVADAVGRIAESNLKNMASFSDNASTRLQKLSADWENLKVAVGQAVNALGASEAGGVLDGMINHFTFSLQVITGNVKAIDKLTLAVGRFNQTQPKGKEFLEKYENLEKAAKAAGVKLILLTDEATGLRKVLLDKRTGFLSGTDEESKKLIMTLDVLKEQLKELNDQFDGIDVNDKKKLINIGNEIKALDLQIKKLEELRKAKEVKPMKMEFLFDAEAEGSTAEDYSKLVNEKIIRDTAEFAAEVAAIGTSAEFAGGALVKLEEPLDAFKEVAKETINISGLVAGGIMDIANAFGEAASGSINFGDAILRSLAGFAQQFGALLIATGIGEITFKKFSGPAMIAAGAALVAIGGAVRGAISNRPSLGGGGGSGRGGASSFGSQNYALAQNAQTQFSFDGVIRGQDLYIMMRNYMENNKSTRSS